MLFGSGAAQEMHRRWFEARLPDGGVAYGNRSDALHGMAISGPQSRVLLSRICRDDVSNGALKFRDIRRTFVAGVPAVLARLSFSGELGYEIYCAPQFQMKLFERIEDAGADLGLKLYGARALMSLRLEKGWGAWTLDFRPDFTAAQSGLDVFIDWDKNFVGKAAAAEERDSGPGKRLVVMTVETADIDVTGDEAIMHDGACVGYVTSGGYAHWAGKSVAFGYVPPELAADGTAFEVEINGEFYPAALCARPLYDADGIRMRA
jgi:dimethylglycine dehydrogenase